MSVVTDGDDVHDDAHDVDGVGGDGTPWSMVDWRVAARHARALGRSLPQRLVVVVWTREARGAMIARRRPSASAPCAAAARSASATLASDGGALVLRSTLRTLRAALTPLAYGPVADWRSLPLVNETQEIVVVARARSDATKAAARDGEESSSGSELARGARRSAHATMIS